MTSFTNIPSPDLPVIPAQAGIQCLAFNAIGSPLKPVLECVNRGRG